MSSTVLSVERRLGGTLLRVTVSGRGANAVVEAAGRSRFRGGVGGIPVENVVLAAAAARLGFSDIILEPSIDVYAPWGVFRARADVAFPARCRGEETLVVLEAKRFENPLSLEASLRHTGFRARKAGGAWRIANIAYELGMRLSDLPKLLGIVYHVFAFTPKGLRRAEKVRESIVAALGLTERHVTVLEGWSGEKAVNRAVKRLREVMKSYSCRRPES